MEPKSKVVIVGAGIGGLTLARALRAQGLSCEVFERAAQLEPVGAGLLLHPNAMLALGQLGVAAAVASAGRELLIGGGAAQTGKSLQKSSLAAVRDAVGAGTFGIARSRLQDVLLDGQPAVHCGRTFSSYEEHVEGVTVAFEDGSTAQGELLVGADGLRSRVRAQALGEGRLRYAGYTSWRGIARFTAGFPPDELLEIWGRGARFGVVPIGHGETYWFAVANAPEGERDTDALAEVRRRFAPWSAAISDLLAATPAERVFRTDIHDRVPVARWSTSRVTLLGDAAHPMTPNLGQGACMAIEDALVLAHALARESNLADAFSTYESRRIPRTTRLVTSSWQMGRLAQLVNPFAIWLRNWLLRLTPVSVVQRQMLANARFEL